jgi:EAL domain-containing protein (putative c-di-GMP-specific phosphodiesterase class I)
MRVVAEGVEISDQHTELSGLGCAHAQGYFYARPMPADRFADWLLYRTEDGIS